jgi:putative two-component system response regulator
LFDSDEYIRKRANFQLNKGLFNPAPKTSLSGQSQNQQQLSYNNSQNLNVLQISDTSKMTGNSHEILDLRVVKPIAKIIDRKIFKQNHSMRVARGTYQMSNSMGLPLQEVNLYYMAALLHDMGYFDVFSELTNKKGKLSKEECDIIRSHPFKGIELLDDFAPLPQIVHDGILYHHERWDGNGYPEGLAGENIPMVARVVGIIDVFEAMVSPRPHRPPMSDNEAIQKIREGAGTVFDPQLMQLFVEMASMGALFEGEEWKKY